MDDKWKQYKNIVVMTVYFPQRLFLERMMDIISLI